MRQRQGLMRTIGQHQLVSIYRTFDEQGSPANSWAPLAASTVRNKKSKASAGRKTLILSGRLRNSIHAEPTDSGVVIGSNLVYARVQQEGSADRGAGEGPQARIPGRSVSVAGHRSSFQRPAHYYGMREVIKGGKTHRVPFAMRTGVHEITDKHGRTRKVRAAYQGPSVARQQTTVRAHKRFQNIPARPYLVLRPEDPARIEADVKGFILFTAASAGLRVGGAS
jgi:phage gpG-like protein